MDFKFLQSNNSIIFYSNGGQRLRVLSNGNVGIGTFFTNYRLDVITNKKSFKFLS